LLSHPSRSTRALFIALIALAAAGSANAQDKPGDFATQLPMTLSGEGPWYRVDLPLAIQLGAQQANLGDVRVFDANGQAQAYALSQGQPQSRESQTPMPVKWFALYTAADAGDKAPTVRVQRNAGGTVVEVRPGDQIEAGEEVLRGWLLDTSTIKGPLGQLTLDWDIERQGFQRFSIEASDDLQHWQSWGEGQMARLSFSDKMVEQRDIALPGKSTHYLRLLWISPHTAPTLTAAQVVSANPDRSVLPLVWSQPLTGITSKAGEYSWQLPNRLAVERVKINISQANSLAPVTLSGRSDASKPWQGMGDGVLYRLTQNAQEMVQDELPLPGRLVQQLKLDVDERGGGLGSVAPTLRFAVRSQQLVFLAKGTGPFTLAVGSSNAKPADLPLSTLIPNLTPQTMASLDSAHLVSTPIVAASPLAAQAAGTDWKRIGLWAVLLLGVAFLGWMALSLLRRPPAKS
jgi:hypothetical protein